MTNSDILIVDDDSDALLSLVRVLKGTLPGERIHAATSAAKALTLVKETRPAVAVVDLSLDEKSGIESGFALMRELLSLEPTCRVIVLTGHSGVDYGVRALREGAASFIGKPADIAHLSVLIQDGINQSHLRRHYDELKRAQIPTHDIVGRSAAIDKVRKEITYAAQTSLPVFITGETGTGKGLCARVLHELSERGGGRFVRYQPTFGTPDLVNSDLFGHVKGAFTGASGDRNGLFAEARGGTLFLDEIDELPLENQVALLGVLQERRFRPVGSSKELETDVRVLSASNHNIEDAIEQGKLRRDLYHRLAHIVIDIPPLRSRREDIPDLVAHVLTSLQRRERVTVYSCAPDAVTLLASREWRGNIRELEGVVQSAAYRAQFEGRGEIVRDDISGSASPISGEREGFHARVSDFKMKLVQEALQRHGGNQVKAARELGLDRMSLRRILAKD